jgi:hypothetical protein
MIERGELRIPFHSQRQALDYFGKKRGQWPVFEGPGRKWQAMPRAALYSKFNNQKMYNFH